MGNIFSDSENENFKQSIKDVINNIEEVSLDGQISIGKNRTIDKNKYVWLFYQSLIITSEKDRKNNIGFEKLIYKILDAEDTACTGVVDIHMDEKDNLWFITKTTQNYNDIEKPDGFTEEFIGFVDELIHRIDDDQQNIYDRPCSFTTLLCGVSTPDSGHQNIIILFNDKHTQKITVCVYDPIGIEGDPEARKISNKFIQYLVSQGKGRLVAGEPIQVNCITGLQYVANDSFGWCVMFAYFWLYCVLAISNKITGYITLKNISDVEKLIIEHFKIGVDDSNQDIIDYEGLMNKVINFAIYIMNEYMNEYMIKYEIDQNELQKTFEQILASDPDIIISYTNNKRKPNRSMTDSRKRHIKKTAEEEPTLARIGQHCDDKNDCLSWNCVENKCT
jgi:hypothetical protein